MHYACNEASPNDVKVFLTSMICTPMTTGGEQTFFCSFFINSSACSREYEGQSSLYCDVGLSGE